MKPTASINATVGIFLAKLWKVCQPPNLTHLQRWPQIVYWSANLTVWPSIPSTTLHHKLPKRWPQPKPLNEGLPRRSSHLKHDPGTHQLSFILKITSSSDFLLFLNIRIIFTNKSKEERIKELNSLNTQRWNHNNFLLQNLKKKFLNIYTLLLQKVQGLRLKFISYIRLR